LSILTKRLLFLFIFSALLFSVKNAAAQVQFVENKGQWNQKVNYRGDFGTGSFFLEHKGFTVLLNKPEDVAKLSQYMHGEGRDPKTNPADTFTFHSFAYNVTFLGAAEYPKAVPDKPLPTYNNYFIGNDQSKWAGECKIFTAVTYKDVYPNIDVRYYSTNDQLKYDFIVHPGGNPAAIALRYDGVKKLSVKDKELIIGTSLGDVKELAPFTYQANTAGNGEVEAKYVVRDNVVTFDVKKYDPSVTLVIDPQIIFSSFTGSTADNWGYTATPGPDGSFFAGGIVFAAGYPVSPGAFQTQFHGGSGDGIFPGVDMGIFKFSPNGSTRVYATYIGGNGDEQPHSMIADPQGNLIIAGRSNSSNYPELTPLNLRSTNYDIVVTKLNAAGSALIGSVRLGGTGNDGVNIRPKYVQPFGADRLRRNYGDDARSEVILDAAGNIYVSSCTQSADFNGMAGSAIQPVFGGTQDGVILKFNPNLSGVLFQTYFGGSNDDACFVAAIDPITSNLYVGGATSSTTLPGNKTGVIQGTNAGGLADGFVTILRPDGSAIIKTTFLGTGGIDIIYGLKFDKVGSPYVMGTTTGTWPIVNAAYSVAGSKQFISKLKTDLSAFDYSTVFGTSSAQPNISPIAFLVDRCENVYVSGWGGGINTDQGYSTGNTTNMPEINPLTGIPGPDGRDFYFFVLKKDAQVQLFGSHFGQNGGLGDHVDGGTSRFDANGVIYQAICANCESGYKSSTPIPFPVTTGVWSTRNESAGCNEAAVKINMNFSGVGAEIQSIIDGVANDTLGCIPLTVNFKDLQQRGVTYYWNFNSTVNPGINDQTTTVPQTSFTFTIPGVYRVRLISEDLNTCNLRDTSYITIKAGDNRVTPSFTRIKLGACTSNQYQFTNTSTNSQSTSFGPQSFVWNYGDGSANDTAALTPPRIHTFPGPGTYFVTLTVIDPAFCNAPDTLRDTLRINPTVDARPAGPSLGCAPFTASFQNNSLAGITWKWEFYDAATNTLIGTSTDFEPTFLFPNIGSYKYRLIAFDPTTCNLVDTSEFLTLQVLPKPTAAAGWGPNPPQANVPVSFTNGSVNANRYLWDFGDSETSTLRAPVHEYNATGTYNAYLVAYNEAGCTDTAFLVVDVIVNPLLDVPNAFTPGRFGSNGIVSVRGFGIGKMAWKIYNRWGQVVFESTTKKSGWNGYYKGVLQPTDVYTYTLDVEFTDGKKLRKTGDITLLR
jgi:gliding motility-associated-like protein